MKKEHEDTLDNSGDNQPQLLTAFVLGNSYKVPWGCLEIQLTPQKKWRTNIIRTRRFSCAFDDV